MMIDMTGLRFGRFVVSARVAGEPKISAWRCQCDCGTTKVVRGCDLRQGKIKSCGCWHRERSRMAMNEMNNQRSCSSPAGERPAALRRGYTRATECVNTPAAAAPIESFRVSMQFHKESL